MNKKSLKVGMILDRDFPPDDRPEKEALSLINAGYEVHLLCYTATQKPLKENYKGIKITRFPLNEKIHKKFSAAYLVLPIYRWIYTKQIERFIKDNNLDILHLHDLPMADIASKMAKKYNLKLVLDQHEYWSNWIGKTFHYNTALGKIVKYFSNWTKYEHDYLHKADLVITVSENLRNLYINEVNLPPEKTINVPNTPSQEIFNDENIENDIIRKYSSHFMIFYSGAIDILRGVDLIVESIAKLVNQIPNMKLVLAGRFARGCNILEQAESLGIRDLIEYIGWLEVDQIPSYISASKVCIFTPPPIMSTEINNTIATKVYQYVSMKKPIIVSNAKMMRDFIVENELGFSIESYSSDILAEKLLYLFNNYVSVKNNVEKKSQNLINKGEIYWHQTVGEMINFYQNFEPDDKII
jgi:glycosyltransferase involved in cell wall biosynthesis